jgi:hypothetical protein
MSRIRADIAVAGRGVSSGNRVPVELAGELNSFLRDVQRGNVDGSRIITQWAGVSLTTGQTRNLWARGATANQPVQTSAVALEIVSAATTDTAAGTGARTVYVEGVDDTFALKSGTYTMNGQTAVSMGSGWLRINFMEIATAGANQTNNGTISVQIAAGGTIQAQMSSPHSTANHINYTVPLGKVAYILQVSFGSMGDTQVQTAVTGTTTKTLPLLSTSFLGWLGKTGTLASDLVFQIKHRMFAYRGAQLVRDFSYGIYLPEKSIYQPSAQNLTADTIEFIADVMILEEDAP